MILKPLTRYTTSLEKTYKELIQGAHTRRVFQKVIEDVMPPVLKIIFVLLGIAPFLRLFMSIVVFSSVMALLLMFTTVCGLLAKNSVYFVVVYSSFSLLLLCFSRKRADSQQVKSTQWTLLKNSAVRIVGIVG